MEGNPFLAHLLLLNSHPLLGLRIFSGKVGSIIGFVILLSLLCPPNIRVRVDIEVEIERMSNKIKTNNSKYSL